MAIEGDKLQSLISKMVEIETAEQPAGEVVEMDPAEQAREELEQTVSDAYKMLNGVDFDAFKTDAEQIQFEQIVGDLVDLIRRMRGPQ